MRLAVYREVRGIGKRSKRAALRIALDKELSALWRTGQTAWRAGDHQKADEHLNRVYRALIIGPFPLWYRLLTRLVEMKEAFHKPPDHMGRMRALCDELEALVGGQAADVHCVEKATYDAAIRSFGPRTNGIKEALIVLGASTAVWTVGLIEGQILGVLAGVAIVYSMVQVGRWDRRLRKAQASFTEAMERHVKLARLGATNDLPNLRSKPGL